ncbi:hypothetical protein CSOJ01_01684 [Colletotrichum sojae]|uniref:Uncharacterized protein n=1 Tax=Colletotrichum sojae TaxID=2175907 RepID=A0A8H6N427_9PEZI|nr:hypothetical protein CSOJ01_01684 [Colletotrichum sojae]
MLGRDETGTGTGGGGGTGPRMAAWYLDPGLESLGVPDAQQGRFVSRYVRRELASWLLLLLLRCAAWLPASARCNGGDEP